VAAFDGCQVTVFLNRFDPGNELHRRNRDWLVQINGSNRHGG